MDAMKYALGQIVKDAVKLRLNLREPIGLPDEIKDVEVQDVTHLITRLRIKTEHGIRYFDVQFKESI